MRIEGFCYRWAKIVRAFVMPRYGAPGPPDPLPAGTAKPRPVPQVLPAKGRIRGQTAASVEL